MNLLQVLQSRIEALPKGDHILGLKSVLQHIEVAEKHLLRGQSTAEATAYTDAIYRTNQAFEGSLKEAYRVITGKDPAGTTPHKIETHLQTNKLLRDRVLAQFTNYRQEWRNPSTHDYRLDFDDDEALLAIVTVTAFAIVLVDQITEHISFMKAKEIADSHPAKVPDSQPLLERVLLLIEQFTKQFNQSHISRPETREPEIVGALAGFMSSTAPDLKTLIATPIAPGRNERPDIIISSNREKLILEIKRARPTPQQTMGPIQQVANYMNISGIAQAILFFYRPQNTGLIDHREQLPPGGKGRIVVVATQDLP